MKVISFFLAVLLLVSCGEKKLSPTEYGNKLVNEVFNPLSQLAYDTRMALITDSCLTKEQNIALVTALSERTDSCIKLIESLNYPDKAKRLHHSLLRTCCFQRDSINSILFDIANTERKSEAWYGHWVVIETRLSEVASVMQNETNEAIEEFSEKTRIRMK